MTLPQGVDLGDCFWHPGTPFDVGLKLCEDNGIVREGSSRFWKGTDYNCSGGAHFAGMHIRCTSPAHQAVEPREGMATVYDHQGTYLGCIGVATWQALVTETNDALPEGPERIAEPLSEDLERLLRDPELAVPQDVAPHRLMRAHLRANPEATVTRSAYLNLWALIETGVFDVGGPTS